MTEVEAPRTIASDGPVERFSKRGPCAVQDQPSWSNSLEEEDCLVDISEGATYHHHINDEMKNDETPPPPSSSISKWCQALRETAIHRIKEANEILVCFDDPQQKLLLVEGSSGAGKTRLIERTLSAKIKAAGGYLLVGKCDPLQQPPEPFDVGFVAAFSQFVTQVVQHGAINPVRAAFAEAGLVGRKDCLALVEMMPILRQILLDDEGEIVADPEVAVGQNNQQTPVGSAMRRFGYFLSMLLRVVSSLGVPAVLLLEDMHFADQSFWEMLWHIVSDLDDYTSLLVVVTYTKNIVVQEAFEKIVLESGCTHHTTPVHVGNLGCDDVGRFLADALDMRCSRATAELASLVFGQTNGHVMYIVEFVKYLLERGLLRFNDSKAGWSFDVQQIKASMMTMTDLTSISDFLTFRLRALSIELQQFLKVASCCGTHVAVDLLRCVHGEMTIPLLQEASVLELMKHDHVTETCSFQHDAAQQAVYDMIPVEERGHFHLEIGRRMWEAMKAADLERSLFVLTCHFYFSSHLVTVQKERYELAQLCLLTGRKAAASSTFRTACVYLNLGIEFLGERGWKDQYSLSLSLYNAAAEMHLCFTDFDEMERLVDTVIKEARPSDRIIAETTRVYAMGMMNKQNEAIDLGIQLLAKLGESFPRRLSTINLLIEVVRVRKRVSGKSDEELLCLRTMSDTQKVACISILNLMLLHTVSVRPKLTPFVVLKMTILTLNHGQCLMSPIAFAAYGFVLGRSGRIDEGYRFGQLAIKMLERLGQDEYLPRVYGVVFGTIYPLKRPMPEAIVKLQEGYRVGLETGDFEFACLNANLYLSLSLDAGMPLPSLDKEYARMTSVMTKLGQETMLRYALPTVQTIHHFMGFTEDPLASKGDVMDFEVTYNVSLQSNQSEMVVLVTLHRLILLCIFDDFAGAFIQATRCLGVIADMPNHLAGSLLFISIAFLENATSGFWRKQKALRIARRAASLLKKLALCCPFNYSHMRSFMDAEVAAAKGREAEAFELYSSTIACARSRRVLMVEAFGNERCGRFLYKVQRLDEARSFFTEACVVYKTWGGMAKALRLKEEMCVLFPATKAKL